MDRRSTSTTINGSTTSTTTRVYEDTSDNPAWATTTTGNTTETTRYLSSIGGDLALTLNVDTGFVSTAIVDTQGSVVATTSQHTDENDLEENTPSPPATVWSALQQFDEYGNTLETATTAASGALNYAWLGGKERATDTTGLVLMGVRLYNSATGYFTSVDPVKGGNTTRYTYPQDPINRCDSTGMWAQSKKECQRIVQDMYTDISVINKRGNELVNDKRKLPLYGKDSIDGHIMAFRQRQTSLWNNFASFTKGLCARHGVKMPRNWMSHATRNPKLHSSIVTINNRMMRKGTEEYKNAISRGLHITPPKFGYYNIGKGAGGLSRGGGPNGYRIR